MPAIRHSNIYRILVRITDAIIGDPEEKRVSCLRPSATTAADPAATPLSPPRVVFHDSAVPISAIQPRRSVSLRGTRKPFLSCALCVYPPLSTFLLFAGLARLTRFFPGRSISDEQVVSTVRGYRCNCSHTGTATPSGQQRNQSVPRYILLETSVSKRTRIVGVLRGDSIVPFEPRFMSVVGWRRTVGHVIGI